MCAEKSGLSPNILIYLEIGDKRIYLSDLLYNTAKLSENTELPLRTRASLVIEMDGVEKREQIVLDKGVTLSDKFLNFSYEDSSKFNGRKFALLD